MIKPSKQTIINALIEDIKKGKPRGQVLGKAGNKWGISRTTFDRHWKTANEQHAEVQRKAKEAADKVYIEESEKAARRAVMGKIERQEVLTQIARGEIPLQKPMVVDKMIEFVEIVPEWMDRKNAIAELNKMDGDYAPVKLKHEAGDSFIEALKVISARKKTTANVQS